MDSKLKIEMSIGDKLLFINDMKAIKKPLKLLRECRETLEDLSCYGQLNSKDYRLINKIKKYERKIGKKKKNG